MVFFEGSSPPSFIFLHLTLNKNMFNKESFFSGSSEEVDDSVLSPIIPPRIFHLQNLVN